MVVSVRSSLRSSLRTSHVSPLSRFARACGWSCQSALSLRSSLRTSRRRPSRPRRRPRRCRPEEGPRRWRHPESPGEPAPRALQPSCSRDPPSTGRFRRPPWRCSSRGEQIPSPSGTDRPCPACREWSRDRTNRRRRHHRPFPAPLRTKHRRCCRGDSTPSTETPCSTAGCTSCSRTGRSPGASSSGGSAGRSGRPPGPRSHRRADCSSPAAATRCSSCCCTQRRQRMRPS